MARKKTPVVIKPSDNSEPWKEGGKPIEWKTPDERVAARKAQDKSDEKKNEAEKDKPTRERFKSFSDWSSDKPFRRKQSKYIVINPEAITAFVEQLQTRIEEKNAFLKWVRSQEYLAESDIHEWIEENVTLPESRERDMNERLAGKVISKAMRKIIVEDSARRKRR